MIISSLHKGQPPPRRPDRNSRKALAARKNVDGRDEPGHDD